MRGVVAVALPAMLRQFLPRVTPALKRKDFQIVRAQVAVEQLVFLPHVLLQLLERAERPAFFRGVTNWAVVFQEPVVGLLDALSRKMNPETTVLKVRTFDFRLERSERLNLTREDHL